MILFVGCMERMYLNSRLTDLGSGQQHKVAPGCGGEETVRDQGLSGNGNNQQMPKITRGLGAKEEECHHNNSVINELQVIALLMDDSPQSNMITIVNN